MPDSVRQDVLRLLDKRKDIETELRHQRDILEANHVTMSTNVLDAEGFPRSDLDIPTIRAAKSQIRCLLHDRELINAKLEAYFLAHYVMEFLWTLAHPLYLKLTIISPRRINLLFEACKEAVLQPQQVCRLVICC